LRVLECGAGRVGENGARPLVMNCQFWRLRRDREQTTKITGSRCRRAGSWPAHAGSLPLRFVHRVVSVAFCGVTGEVQENGPLEDGTLLSEVQ